MSEYKDRWIAALRSGQYKQGTGVLCKVGDDGEQRYCCLGVLAELDGAFVPETNSFGDRMARDRYSGPANSSMYIGKPEHNLAAIPATYEGADAEFLPWVVAAMNDDGRSFEDIADYLETVDF